MCCFFCFLKVRVDVANSVEIWEQIVFFLFVRCRRRKRAV